MNVRPLWQGLRSIAQWVNKLAQWVKITIVILLVLGLSAVFIYLGYRFSLDWTGFISQTGPPLKPNQPFSPGKTFWDWLQLLIIPLVLFVGGFSLNYIVSRNQQKFTNDNQSDTVLRDYLDKISDLLFKDEEVEDSLAHKEDSKVRREYPEHVKNLARLRTLLALRSLDSARKASLLLFLSESGLINKEKDKCIIKLEKADFSKADLSIAYLSNDPLKGRTAVRRKWQESISKELAADLNKVNLSGAILIKAKLRYANLNEADLSQASLYETDLRDAKLTGANLTGADLKETDLKIADLTGSDLTGADLKEAKLRNAVLTRADLTGANLTEADLRGANLTEANLTGADLTEVNLGVGNLTGANLTGANLTGANLTKAKKIERATLTGAKYNKVPIKITCPEKHEHTIPNTQGLEGFEPGCTLDNKDQECDREQCELISKYVVKKPPYEHNLPQSQPGIVEQPSPQNNSTG